MNVLRGLDIPFYISHHTGGYLGNYARNDGEYEGTTPVTEYRPTIDQVMAWNDAVYPSLEGVVQRSVHAAVPGVFVSWGHTDPTDSRSRIERIPAQTSSLAMYDSLFRTGADPRDREPVVDKVLESYRRLRSGAFGDARRLSANDRLRLDEHMQRLAELERKLGTATSCEDQTRPSQDAGWGHPGFAGNNPDNHADYWQLYNEVIALALLCNSTRIATISLQQTFSTYTSEDSDWHQEVAHRLGEPDRQALMVGSQGRMFEHVFLDLCRRLDVEDGNGVTALDNSLVMWAQESGPITHDPLSMPVVTAGSASGFLRTGQYIDYRNRNDLQVAGNDSAEQQLQRPGLLYGQWLATILQSMGLRREDYERPGERGYGEVAYDWWPSSAWPDAIQRMRGDVLPLLRA